VCKSDYVHTQHIQDTAGQERFHALGPIYYRDAAGAVIVYDITDMNSFMKAQSWVRELQRVRGDQVVVVICGNKNDMPNRQVPVDTAEQCVLRRRFTNTDLCCCRYAHSTGAVYCETSAKLNEGIDELFVELAKSEA
jgi:Ras-related protein Rab-21